MRPLGAAPHILFVQSVAFREKTVRSRPTLWIVVAILAAVAGVLFSGASVLEPVESRAMAVLAPVQGFLTSIAHPVADALDTIANLGTLKGKNAELEGQIERLNAEVVRLREAQLENERLRALIGYQQSSPGHRFRPAAVIGRDPTNLVQAVVINTGLNHGVDRGMVVVAAGGLVGKVVKAYENSARVLLITDPSSAVSALVQRTRASGLVTGKAGGALVMSYLAKGEDVALGDLVITSGQGGGFPKGILVGQVVETGGSPSEPFQQLTLRPAVPFSGLEEVLVIMDFAPQPLDGP